MRCLCSLESPARPFHHLVPKHATTSYNHGAPSVISLPQRRRPQSLINNDAGKLGQTQTLLATIQSKQPASVGKSREEAGDELGQISGSDVLWALQRADARKKKKMKKKMKQEQEQRRVSSSAATSTHREEEIAVGSSKVRPLSINPNWATKLDDFEKRLRELSNAT